MITKNVSAYCLRRWEGVKTEFMKNNDTKAFISYVFQPVFQFFYVLAAAAFIFSFLIPNNQGTNFWFTFFSTIGSTLITLAISLPIASYFQMKSNEASFKILNSCRISGIRTIYSNRKHDGLMLRKAINKSAISSSEFFLLGIAFSSFLNLSAEENDQVRQRIKDPKTKLKILILDPNSDAANRRAEIEIGNSTITDIKKTIDNSIVSAILSEFQTS